MTTNERAIEPAVESIASGNHQQQRGSEVLPPPDHAKRGWATRSLLVLVAAVVSLIAGVAIGVRWHSAISHTMGLHSHSAGGDQGGKNQLWTCGMHPQVIQDKPGTCPICQMKLEPMDVVQSGNSAMTGGAAAKAERKVAYWWDPMMNPPYISDRPGKSPMGMDLVPRYEDEVSAGTSVKIDPVVVQNMGVRVAQVTRGPVRQEIRAVGYLQEAQPNVRDVNLRVSGWVEKLYADTVGVALSQGAPLFDLFSPEVQVAVEELIASRKSLASAGADPAAVGSKTARTLFEATRLKLEQWGLDPRQVEKLAQLDRAPRTVTFTSPIDGYLMEKMVVQGAAVKAGDMALRIVDLSTVWLDAQVYAQDLPFIKLGQEATADVEGAPGKRFSGKVVFIHPQVDPQTRTATVRMALDNRELTLRPGLYATAHVQAQLADDALLVPREAVLDTGTRQIVFISEGGGHFSPRTVTTGSAGEDGMVQVLDGLAAGQTVVTSGQFLLDAESRMREAIQKHLSERMLAKGPASRAPESLPSGHTHVPPVTIQVDAHAGHGSAATTVPAPAVGASSELDKVFAEYLALQKVLGAPQQSDGPVDAGALAKAADALAVAGDGLGKTAARAIAGAASELAGKTIAEQRERFKPLSEAVIALAKTSPPSKAVAETLFIAYCPMAPGQGAQWLQTSEVIANPYFATSMKECGTIKGRIAAAGG